MASGRELKRVSFWKPLLGMLSVAALLWAAWGFVGVGLVEGYWRSKFSVDATTGGLPALGQVGDLFGGVNALFAAFAFAGVAVAAYYQHLSWQLLSDEATRSNARHVRESFEPLFFQLLKLPRRPAHLLPTGTIYDHLKVGVTSEGLAHFEDVVQALRSTIATSNAYAQLAVDGLQAPLSGFISMYEELYRRNEAVLGPFWRSQYHIFKLIERSELPDDIKVEYANIARAMLGTDVVFLMTLNCAADSNKEFGKLVDKFGLLKHVARDAKSQTVDEVLARSMFQKTATMSYADRLDFWKSQKA